VKMPLRQRANSQRFGKGGATKLSIATSADKTSNFIARS